MSDGGDRGSSDGGDPASPTEATEQTDVDLATDDALAAVVQKEHSQVQLEALRQEGVYDPDRRIREHDDGTVEIPVTEPPSTSVLRVVGQRSPDRRMRSLEDLLRERGWSDADCEAAPSSWAVVGTVVLVEIPDACPDESAVGDALLELHREADTVVAREGIDGQIRDPERRVIAGIGDTETIHTEHGVSYALDLADVMFSPGNQAERARIAALVAAGEAADANDDAAVSSPPAEPTSDATTGSPTATIDDAAIPDDVTALDPAAGVDDDSTDLDAFGGPREHVFDMFAGAGYFTLPAAIAGARVTAAEIDPDTFGYLVENAQLNGVGDRVSPYVADCREVAAFVDADRVVMGHYDAHEYLDAAFEAVRDGGVLHFHAVVGEPELPEGPIEQLSTAAETAGRHADVVDTRRVKSYGEGVWHVVVDARVSSPE